MDAWASRLTVVWSRVVVPLVLVGVVSAMIALTEQFADVTGLAVLYMAAVMIAAILGGRGAAVIAALAAFIAFDLFFILPRYTLTVANPAEWVTLSVLLLTGLVTGQLAALVRQRTREARANERASSVLFRVAHEIASRPLADGLETAAGILRDAIDAAGVRIEVRTGSPITVAAGEADAVRYMEVTGRHSEGHVLASGACRPERPSCRYSICRVLHFGHHAPASAPDSSR